MREKKESAGLGCDPKTAASCAASSIASYFKEQGWKIVTFFPNTPCLKDKNKKNSSKQSDIKKPN